MIIGFTERIHYVSEDEVPGEEFFVHITNVTSVRTAERVHRMVVRLQETSSNATVDTLISSSSVFDASFGIRQGPNGAIEERRELAPGSLTLHPPLQTRIRNDFRPEDRECFTIRIVPVDFPDRRERFTCNEDGEGADNHFCEHTICIEDDDDSE